ncbi:MAG: hypothetical protein WCO23_00690 [bacterium]
MKYKVCDKCGEVVTKTGFISSSTTWKDTAGNFAKCHNKECGKFFPKSDYEKLKIEEF